MKFYLTILSFFILGFSKAQTTTDSIKATITNMFLAMKNADTILLKSCFADSAFLQTITKNKLGETIVKNESIVNFISQIGSLQKNVADEQITFGAINIDANLANVWTPYKFYFNQKFSHCGVNNFVLVKINSKWLIQYIIDTRRKNCE